MDKRKLDLVFFIALEDGKDLTFEQITEYARKYSARTLWFIYDHMKRYKAWKARCAA